MSPTQGPGREEFSENAKIFVDYHLLDLRTVCEGGFVCWSVYGDFRLHYGTFGGPFMFAGNNFTLTGAMELAGPCPTFYAYGQSIQGCDDGQATFIGAGGGTFVLKGAGQRSIFINEGELFFSQAPLPPLDPTTQQTVTLMEPASFSGGFFGCLSPANRRRKQVSVSVLMASSSPR